MTRSRALLAVLAALTGALVVLSLAALPFLLPASDAAFADGPVVALGGSHQRGETALSLVGTPGERSLLLSAWTVEDSEKAGISCDDAHVECFTPEPAITYGEARTVAALARERGWDHVTVVTSAHHATRSRRLFARCLDVPVAVVIGHDLDEPWPARAGRAVRELASWSVSLAVHRDC